MTKRYHAVHFQAGGSAIQDTHKNLMSIVAHVPTEHADRIEALMNSAYEAGQEVARARMRAALGLGEEPRNDFR